MGYRLNGNNLKRFAELCISHKRKTGRRIYFDCIDKSSGHEVYVILQTVYGRYIKRMEYGFTYADFTIITRDSAAGKLVNDDITGAMDAYRKKTGYNVTADTPGSQPDVTSNKVPEGRKGLLSGNTANLAIGIVVMILIMTLWERRSK